MAGWNQRQKGFIKSLATVIAFMLAGLLVASVADGRISQMETAADMAVFSWLKMFSGWLFAASALWAIVTFRYGRKHADAIREQTGFSRLLTAYGILFWLSLLVFMLAAAIVIWAGMHLGPVR